MVCVCGVTHHAVEMALCRCVAQVCGKVGRTCNPYIDTGNASTIFTDLGVKCTPDPQPWWADNQPCWVSGKTVRGACMPDHLAVGA